MSNKSKVTMAVTILASSLLLSGCGLFGGEEKKEIDPPKDISLVDDESSLKEKNVKQSLQQMEKKALVLLNQKQ